MKTSTTATHPVYLKALAGEGIGAADIAKLIRSQLATRWPGTKFSITSKNYSGGCSISVRWSDGPTQAQVDAVAGSYEGKGFDGSIDLAYYKQLWIYPDGSVSTAHVEGTQGSGGQHPEHIGSAKKPGGVLLENCSHPYIHCSRSVSPALYQVAIDYVKAQNWAELESFDWSAVSVRPSSYDGSGVLQCAPEARLNGDWLSAHIDRAARRVAVVPGLGAAVLPAE